LYKKHLYYYYIIYFFICSTNKLEINRLKNKFGNRIIYFKNRFGNKEEDMFYSEENSVGNIFKNLNGIVDLFLLSKCSLIIGDVASSFSLRASLLNKNGKYTQIKNVHY
tara:strand:+ start:4981 stop:5307 length:327 start_codon:yes stop_codon:yes gene_type:complete